MTRPRRPRPSHEEPVAAEVARQDAHVGELWLSGPDPLCPACGLGNTVPSGPEWRCRSCGWSGPRPRAEAGSFVTAISEVRFVPSFPEEQAAGLLGWTSFNLSGALRIDGVSVRRTREGRIYLSFPRRRDGSGREHDVLTPLDRRAREEIEAQVLSALPAWVGKEEARG
jgi:DNA-binding cell septation regulator SpoVG